MHNGGGREVTCSARLAIAVMFAGRPAFTTQVTIAEGMDSLGCRLISYLSSVVVWAEGSGSTTHDPLYSYRVTWAFAVGLMQVYKLQVQPAHNLSSLSRCVHAITLHKANSIGCSMLGVIAENKMACSGTSSSKHTLHCT